MPKHAAIARALAKVFLCDHLEVEALIERSSHLFGRRWSWVRPLARRICASFAGRTPPRQTILAQFILADEGFQLACEKHAIVIKDRLVARPRMAPVGVAREWDLPSIGTTSELAAWLGLSVPRLEWFADLHDRNGQHESRRLRHYHYRPLAKRSGGIRLIEAPKEQLKEIQRRILVGILERIPTHEAAHGFRRGHSIRTFATPHVGKRVVLRMDLQEFFPSISAARIEALFRTAGYPERVADLLAGLCTHGTPHDVWQDAGLVWDDDRMRAAFHRYARRHLPQGAPTSPALANLCAYRLDCRVSGLASTVGAIYTRYADDLVISGGRDLHRVVKRLGLHVAAIAIEEGFDVNHRKTRIMHESISQRVAGIIVNERLNVRRQDYDRLKAILTNCVRHGTSGQNREQLDDFRAHLRGRISFVETVHAERGMRLQAIFDKIAW
jgi:RNA-directed DNA polymerase